MFEYMIIMMSFKSPSYISMYNTLKAVPEWSVALTVGEIIPTSTVTIVLVWA